MTATVAAPATAPATAPGRRYAIGIDVGGTFTDAVAADGRGHIVAAKTPSTPPDYSRGVLNAVDELADTIGITPENLLASTAYLSHGTTSSINALIQRDVARVGLLTTKGHRDSLFIMNVEGRHLGRSPQEIQDILRQRKPEPLIPKSRAREVTERVDPEGRVLVSLDEDGAREQIRALLDDGVEAIAVSLLWSFRNPAHEQRLRELAHELDPDIYVTLSSDLTPRIREFSRTATTVMNAQIAPSLRDYLQPLAATLLRRQLNGPLLIMQGSGGTVTAEEAPAAAITTVGSVLSGGVVGAGRLAEQLGHTNVLATDVGGTTFLVGLIVDGTPLKSSTTIINHHPINVPALQVHAIGAGGGAIAWVDEGNNIKVGPHSAQAVPGPACYGAGGERPTNTDANLVLGILSERGLLDGRRPLRRDLAQEALARYIGKPLGLSAEDAAAAVYAIQNAQTADMLRKVVLESGHDPRDFVVYAFGGAGPAHCAAYAAELGVSEVVVPLGPVAAAFSAYGLACSPVTVAREFSDPSPFPTDVERVRRAFKRLESELADKLRAQQLDFAHVEIRREVDLRYTAQFMELATPVPAGTLEQHDVEHAATEFEALYARLNGKGSGYREAGIQAITYRAEARAALPFDVSLPAVAPAAGPVEDAVIERRPVHLDVRRGFVETPIYDYRLLGTGHVIEGPAVVQVPTTTVVIPTQATGRIDSLGNLVISYV